MKFLRVFTTNQIFQSFAQILSLSFQFGNQQFKTNMHSNNQDSAISLSTKYRYKISNREADLSSFLHFKKEHQNFFDNRKIQNVKRVYQHGICGRNEHKHTVVVDRIGNIKIQDLSKVFDDDQFVHYTCQRLIELSQQVLQQKQQLIWIIDLNGKIMQLASKKILEDLKKIIHIADKYFPQMLNKLIFVNTPMLFDTIWTKINPSISKQTLNKIIMIGDQLENLSQFAEPSILPTFLGGQVQQQQFLQGKRNQSNKQNQSQSQEQEDFDFSKLKQALSGLKVGGSNMQSVSQTPLNTQADDK